MPPKFTSALMGALAATVVILIFNYLSNMGGFPPNPVYGCLACLSYMVCGLVAVWHYTSEHSVTLSGSQGVVLGLYSGLLAGVLVAVLAFMLIQLGVFPGPEQMLEEMEQSGVLDAPGAGFTRRMIEMSQGPLGLLFGVVQGCIGGGILGLTGGAIGRAIWKKGEEEEA